MSRRKFLKSGGILTLGNGVSALSSFLRNIIIARLITVEDFGIASLFALTMSAVEIAGNLSVDKLIIQNKNGDNERFQASGHAFMVLRGLISGVILFFTAGYVANFFNVPNVTWAFQILAVISVIKGFFHLDMARFQRDMNFLPLVIAETLPQVIVLIFSVPLALWLNSYAVVVWLILIQAIIYIVLSHVLAKRKYSVNWNKNDITHMYKFGWPLLINGILIFIILQGDKAIIGRTFSMEILGWYSAAFILTLSPALIITKIINSMVLPWLSKTRENGQLFIDRSMLAINYCLMSGLILSVCYSLFGSEVMILLFGNDYAEGGKIIALLAFMQFIRIAKAGPILVAMSAGDTKNPMLSNLVRGIAFLIAAFYAWYGTDVTTIVIIGLFGELAAFFMSMSLLLNKVNNKLIMSYKPAFVSFMLAFVFMQFENILPINDNFILNKMVMILVAVLFIFITLQFMPGLKMNLKYFLYKESKEKNNTGEKF